MRPGRLEVSSATGFGIAAHDGPVEILTVLDHEGERAICTPRTTLHSREVGSKWPPSDSAAGAATFTEPACSDHRRHAAHDAGVLTRQPTRDCFPEPLPILTPSHRRPTGRTHRRTSRTMASSKPA